MKKKTLGIRGAYGESNFGDDALMFFLYKWAEENQLEAFFIGKENNYIKYYIPNDYYISKEKSYRYFFNVLIFGGGTQFFSFEKKIEANSKLKILFKDPIYFFKKVLMTLEKRFLTKEKNYNFLFSIGIGLGPFVSNSKIENTAKLKIKSMHGLFVRDDFSFNFAKKQNKETFMATDICFLPEIIDFKPYKKTTNKIKKIGVILRDWKYSNEGQKYLNRIIEEAKHLTDNNYKLDFILFKEEVDCESKLTNLNYNVIKWNPNNQTLEGFIKILSGYDLFISARFHGVIFGALLNIPSIAIEIEPKLKITKELLGRGVRVWEQPFNKNLLEIIEGFDYKQAKQTLNSAVKKHNFLAQNMFDELLKMIENKKAG
ncbi:hypothetical protein BFR04_05685 [Gaetbulibacter sp. 4G1]|nr:polysaccharide pyruvyl transferase family protein [Gaetbulibacter sp. 4G1]PIA79012.1 hypothetical protein BFR04_05685 [Gaetbulibacter sp. 4G1]